MKIEKLTAQQEKQLIAHREEWLKIGLQTSAADKETSKRIISGFYERIGKKAPQFIFVQSPLGAQVLLNLISQRGINSPSSPSIESNLGDSLRDSLRTSLGDSLRDSLWDSLGTSLRTSLRDSLRTSLGDSLRDSLWDSLRDSLGDSLRTSLRDSLRTSLRDSLWDSLRDSLGDSLRTSLGDSLRTSLGDSLWASLRDRLGDSLWASLGDSLWASLGDSLGTSLWTSLGASLGASLRASLRDRLGDSLWASLGASLGASLRASLRDSLRDSLWASLGDSLGDSLRTSLRDRLGDSLWASLGASLRDSLWDSKLSFYSTWFWGSVDSYWIAYYLFAQQYLKQGIYDAKKLKLLQEWGELAHSCFWWYAYENICIVCDSPNAIHMDERHRLHSVDSPAVSFADGWNIYAIHGVRVAENIVMQADKITSDMVMQERNSELQRIMVGQMGEDKFISQGGFKPIHEDYYGKLYRVDFPNDEALLKVRVTDPSTGRVYFLGVPSRDDSGKPMLRAKQAVAWTFALSEEQYMLEAES